MTILKPFNFKSWLDDNRDKLKPPVGNKNLYPMGKDFIVMVVAGPNARKDYHFNETEEWFYQLEGDIIVRIQQDHKAVDIPIKEGEMFLLPARIPHSPIRSEGSLGLVIERVRIGTSLQDGLLWYCDKCNNKLHEVYFPLIDVEKDFLPKFREFYNSIDLRTCGRCGHLMESDPRFTD